MKYRLVYSPAAEKFVLRLSPVDYLTVSRVIQSLADDPRGLQTKKVIGSEYWRIRAGNYRAIYLIKDKERTVYVERVARRNEKTYRGL